MVDKEDVSFLIRFVKLLGDRNRLGIIGLLATRPRTLEELLRELHHTTRADMKRHLHLLEDARWIEPEPDETYAIRLETLANLRAAIARLEIEPASPKPSMDAVVGAYFDPNGRLRSLPTQRERRLRVLCAVAERSFSLGRLYDEQEVDEELSPLYRDTQGLREALVSAGILEHHGRRYWLSPRGGASHVATE